MANISSYNQLSSWNEDDDLLFVQQPDAPKKAHPSQMKEYILEGLDVESVGGTGKYISEISEADGKISATEETMDDAPTQDSNKPVKSGGVFNAIDDSVSLKTATGNPITLTDAANANAEELVMAIEPIQDLHGYSKPWPGGGGKNIAHIDSTKIYSTNKNPSDPITGIADGMLILVTASNGYIRNENLGSYTINNPNSITVEIVDNGSYGAGIVVEIDDSKTYTLNLVKTGGSVRIGWLNSDGSNLSYTGEQTLPCNLTPPSGAKYLMIVCCSGQNVENTFSNIQLEVGTSATTFEPWENICPISGLTEGKVFDYGENLVDINNLSLYRQEQGITFTLNEDGSVTANGTATGRCQIYWVMPNDLARQFAGKTLSGNLPIDNCLLFLELDGSPYTIYARDSGEGSVISNDIASAPAGAGVSIIWRIQAGVTLDHVTITPRISDANTATITFGQTVYGGSVNFKTGEVTVTHGMVDLGTLEWVSWSTYGFKTYDLNNVIKITDNLTPINAISSEAIILSWAQYAANTENTLKFALYKDANATFIVGGKDMGYADAATFKTAMSGVQLCYELATPTTLTLTPAELELLKGNNTITANGAEISIKYYPDNAIGALAGRVDGKADITYVDNAVAIKTEYFKSSSNNTTQTINIGAISENRLFLFACGFHTNYVLELIAISANGASIVHVPVANSSINSISAISYNASTGVMTITVENNPFCYGRMTRLS